MGSYDKWPARSVIKNLISIPGWFETDAGNAPPTRSSRQFTVGAPTAGVYTLTLRQKPTRFHGVTATLLNAADTDHTVKVTGFSAALGTVTFETRATADGAAANIDGPLVMFGINAEYT